MTTLSSKMEPDPRMLTNDLQVFLRSSQLIDWRSSSVLKLAGELGLNCADSTEIARSCFEWVRDEISHSGDAKLAGSTCKASDVLTEGNGWCFAKSHLLAALLRAHEIPAGFCYQRLKCDDERYTLHGLNAVYLPPFGWYRADARGNKEGVNAQFTPPTEQLAWPSDDVGEMDFPNIYPEPLEEVCSWLTANQSYEQALGALPDLILNPGEEG